MKSGVSIKFLQSQNKVLVPCRENQTFSFVVVSVLAANYEPKIAQYQRFVYYGSETRGCEGNRKTTVEPLSCFAAVRRYFFGVFKHYLGSRGSGCSSRILIYAGGAGPH